MPVGTPYHGFIPPYTTIRIDAFSTPRDCPYPPAKVNLLTHTHSDHIVGLDAKSFGEPVLCSHDSRKMLLRAERGPDRIAFDNGELGQSKRPWGHLNTVMRIGDPSSIERDLLKSLPLDKAARCDVGNNEEVLVTPIDANHCPGSVMYLIEGPKGAVLHTGDVRAEPKLIESLRNHPALSAYITPNDGDANQLKILEAIYLDTSCVLANHEIPTKAEAVASLLELLAVYPPETKFFINAWTWGYEELLKAISVAFKCQIHVDRYKHNIYNSISYDASLSSALTRDASVRFHACERFNRCECVEWEKEGVVYINPVACGISGYREWERKIKEKLKGGEMVNHLIVPLARHSPLPELRALVSLFKPKRVVPLTVYQTEKLNGLDWACIPAAFKGCMADGAAKRIWEEMRQSGIGLDFNYDEAEGDLKDTLSTSAALLCANADAVFPDMEKIAGLVGLEGVAPGLGFEMNGQLNLLDVSRIELENFVIAGQPDVKVEIGSEGQMKDRLKILFPGLTTTMDVAMEDTQIQTDSDEDTDDERKRDMKRRRTSRPRSPVSRPDETRRQRVNSWLDSSPPPTTPHTGAKKDDPAGVIHPSALDSEVPNPSIRGSRVVSVDDKAKAHTRTSITPLNGSRAEVNVSFDRTKPTKRNSSPEISTIPLKSISNQASKRPGTPTASIMNEPRSISMSKLGLPPFVDLRKVKRKRSTEPGSSVTKRSKASTPTSSVRLDATVSRAETLVDILSTPTASVTSIKAKPTLTPFRTPGFASQPRGDILPKDSRDAFSSVDSLKERPKVNQRSGLTNETLSRPSSSTVTPSSYITTTQRKNEKASQKKRNALAEKLMRANPEVFTPSPSHPTQRHPDAAHLSPPATSPNVEEDLPLSDVQDGSLDWNAVNRVTDEVRRGERKEILLACSRSMGL